MNRLKLVLVLAAAALSGTAQAELQGRDLNGDTFVDAFYDTDLDITWRRNANVKGLMTWAGASTWAENANFGGYTDWRLPTSDTSCTGFNCVGSEMGHLWYIELGNEAGDVTPNTGKFVDMKFFAYWSGTEYAADSNLVWHFNIDGGDQDYAGEKSGRMFAMLVRDGDVRVVPEPGTYALMLAGLGAVGFVARRRRR